MDDVSHAAMSDETENKPKEKKPFQFSISQLIYFTSAVAVILAFLREALLKERPSNVILLVSLYGLSILALTLAVSSIHSHVGKLTGLILSVILVNSILVLTYLLGFPVGS